VSRDTLLCGKFSKSQFLWEKHIILEEIMCYIRSQQRRDNMVNIVYHNKDIMWSM
jgi:hypothetical protein